MVMQARAGNKTLNVGGSSQYDEYVPMIDKTVDAGWTKHVPYQESPTHKGEELLHLTIYLNHA